MVKDNCWLDYEVTIKAIDVAANREILQIIIPKGKSWIRQQFTCTPKQSFMYTASFTPIIWASDENKIYKARRYWSLPAQIKSGETAWEIKACYPKDFAVTAVPPTSQGNCMCDFATIPAII